MGTYKCPDNKRHDNDVVGCGHTFTAEPDDEGVVDCPNCGVFFVAPHGETNTEHHDWALGELLAEAREYAKPHVWRYDATMPAEQRPWIVSREGHDAKDFDTWEDAVRFALEGNGG